MDAQVEEILKCKWEKNTQTYITLDKSESYQL